MDKKLFEFKLKEKFPNLYINLGIHWRDGGMLGGVDVREGWYDIIWDLSEKLESVINKIPEGEERPKVVQIKEKFGLLRYYVNFGTNEIYKLINEAENKSSEICEYCGEPGYKSNYSSWIKTLCNKCHKKRKGK